MPKITIVGIGPGPVPFLTKEAEAELLRAEKIFFRIGAHPVYEWLREIGKHVLCFDKLYTTRWKDPGDIYEFMAEALFKEAALRGEAVYAVPGSPEILEDTTHLIRLWAPKRGVEVTALAGVSFLDQALAQINFDYSMGLQVVLPLKASAVGPFHQPLGANGWSDRGER